MPVNELLVILLLIAASAFFSMSEISLAASRKIKLRLMAEGGHLNAQRVLALQDSPGHFFTVVQIGLNAVAILGGVVGEQALSPYVSELLRTVYDGPMLGTIAFIVSFVFVTSLFVLFADLMPKRLAMLQPERIAVAGVTASDLGEGAIPAILQEAIFLGDHVRLRLSIGDGGEILAKRPAGIGTLPDPGGPVAIAWPEGAARAFQAVA